MRLLLGQTKKLSLNLGIRKAVTVFVNMESMNKRRCKNVFFKF